MGEVKPPPEWNTGKPTEEGLYVGWSSLYERREEPSVYAWTGTSFQHHTGWFDNGITHWIKLDA